MDSWCKPTHLMIDRTSHKESFHLLVPIITTTIKNLILVASCYGMVIEVIVELYECYLVLYAISKK